MSVTQRVLEQYPSLSFLLKDPEVGALLRDAVDPNKGFSPQTFQAKLYETRWWRSRSETQRTFEILSKTDPGEAKRQVSGLRYSVRDYATQLGVNLTAAQTLYMATAMAQQGITDPSDPRIRNAILASPQANKMSWGGPGIGAIHTAERDIGAMLQSEFLRAPSAKGARHWAKLVATGQKTIEDFKAAEMVQAVKRFPHMADLISQGLTPGQIVSSNREIIAAELELRPEQIDVMKNAKWRQLTGIKDPKTGKMRLPTESDAINLARTEKSWWRTQKGRQMDSEAARSVLTLMGARR